MIVKILIDGGLFLCVALYLIFLPLHQLMVLCVLFFKELLVRNLAQLPSYMPHDGTRSDSDFETRLLIACPFLLFEDLVLLKVVDQSMLGTFVAEANDARCIKFRLGILLRVFKLDCKDGLVLVRLTLLVQQPFLPLALIGVFQHLVMA